MANGKRQKAAADDADGRRSEEERAEAREEQGLPRIDTDGHGSETKEEALASERSSWLKIVDDLCGGDVRGILRPNEGLRMTAVEIDPDAFIRGNPRRVFFFSSCPTTAA
jgi:hypothetical protein